MSRSVRGVTLIELLVAIAIFGLLSAMAYRALTVVLESRGRMEQENNKWRGIGQFFARLEQDIAAAAPRPVRDRGNRRVPAFVGNAAAVGTTEAALLLTRTGYSPDPETPAPPRRIGYRLRDGVIEMLAWDVLDQGPRSEPIVIPLLREVHSMELRYLDARGQWLAAWPSAASAIEAQTAIPVGVEIAITLGSGERMTRLFATTVRLRG
jgi:general secretion pathway protein J